MENNYHGNGLINLSLSSNNGQYVYYELYDGNGTTNLKSSYTNGTQSYDVDGLAAGTYYVKNLLLLPGWFCSLHTYQHVYSATGS